MRRQSHSRRRVVRRLLVCVSMLAACHRASAPAPAPAPVAVRRPPPSLLGLTITPTSMTLAVGDNKAVRTTVSPARPGGRYSVRYSSSAPDIAIVDSLGTVTAMAAGSAKVTIVAHADGGDGLDATTLTQVVAVTVVRP